MQIARVRGPRLGGDRGPWSSVLESHASPNKWLMVNFP